jgi:ribosomal protein S7
MENKNIKVKQTLSKISKTKQKIINHLIAGGHKKTVEKQVVKTVKHLQKLSFKNHKKIIQLALTNTLPIFKINKIRIKKKKKKQSFQIPFYLPTEKQKISHSIKNIIIKTKTVNTKSNLPFYNHLGNEILLTAKKQSDLIQIKDENQKIALSKKKYLDNYKWRNRIKK